MGFSWVRLLKCAPFIPCVHKPDLTVVPSATLFAWGRCRLVRQVVARDGEHRGGTPRFRVGHSNRCRRCAAGGAPVHSGLSAPGDPGRDGPGRRRPDDLRGNPELRSLGLPDLRQGPRHLLPRHRLCRDDRELGQRPHLRGRPIPVVLPPGGRRPVRKHRGAVVALRLPEYVRVLLRRHRGIPHLAQSRSSHDGSGHRHRGRSSGSSSSCPRSGGSTSRSSTSPTS